LRGPGLIVLATVLGCFAARVGAQEGARVDGGPGMRLKVASEFGMPLRDISYGPLPANRLDLWIPSGDGPHPVAVHYHGGGFGRGDKNGLDPPLRDAFLSRGFAVASPNYRLAPEARFPGPMLDAARAVQFLRANATAYGLDPSRFVTLGRSAGGALALWVAYTDDLAIADAADPVERQSSRVQGAGVINAQTTFLKADVGTLFGADATPGFYDHLLGRRPDQLEAARASPLVAFSRDDPPTYFIYIEEKGGPIRASRPNSFMHSSRYAAPVERRAARWNVDVEVVETPERDLPAAYEVMADFLVARVN
jgi:acetyl esterase/lipase